MSDIMEGEGWLEAMTPRQLRNAVRTTQADLRRAVEDRAKLLAVCNAILDDLHDVSVFQWLKRVQETVNEVEGKK